MNWLPALDLAAQYWGVEEAKTQTTDMMQELRKAMLELQTQEMMEVDEGIEGGREGLNVVWNVDEDALLRKLAQKYCSDWEEVAARLPGRTPYMCQKRWEKRLKRKSSSSAWKPAEDDLLLALHGKLGDGRWREIALYMPNRSPESLQNRIHLLLHSDSSRYLSSTSSSDAATRAIKAQHLRDYVDRLAARILYCREELRRLDALG